jgi:hypothetical protein
MLRVAILLPAMLAASAGFLSAQDISVSPGTEIPVELRTRIETGSAKPGQPVEFETTEAILIGHDIVVPRGAKVIGHIEQVFSRGIESPDSAVRLSIDRLKWKQSEASLNAVVISVEPTAAQVMLSSARDHFRNPPTFLHHIHIRAHLLSNASTEFYSDLSHFTVSKGLNFLLRQVDPENPASMVSKDHSLNIGPEN